MPEINCLISIILDGEPPPELGLSPLSGCRASCELIDRAFRPFARATSRQRQIEHQAEFEGAVPATGIVVIYLVGHGWTNDLGQFTVSIRSGDSSTLLTGCELV